jgi:predicted membrane protein
MTIDLGGAWPADPRMVFSMAFGGVTLVAPKDLGIRVRMRGFLAGFNAKGFTKEGKTWTSNNYAGAKRKVEIEVSSAIGGVKVEWR